MAGETLVTLEHVSKSYPKVGSGRSRFSALKAALRNRPYEQTHDILKEISFTVKKGQSLGIIGENGAGKSTLLKLIAGVLRPSAGTISVDCRIAALLELGAGFHPEYTGIENIRMNAALSGLSSAELKAKLQSIIDFADIGDYINEPIKHYSSGMVVRLGFAMMTALEPELLITDEVLAVGDESFQKKCIAWMQQYLDNGGTLLLCSHGMYHIKKLCQQAIWMDNGRVREYGRAADVTQSYLNFHERKNRREQQKPQVSGDSYRIDSVAIYNDRDEVIHHAQHLQTVVVKGRIYSPDGRSPVVAIGIEKSDGTAIYGTTSAASKHALKRIDEHYFVFGLSYPSCPLLPGEFIVKAHAMDPEALRLFDTHEMTLIVQGDSLALGNVYLEHQWLS